MATFKARFFDPMLLLRTQRLPEGADWLYEVKLDGYRAIAFKTDRKIHLRSRNDNDFAVRYPSIVEALRLLPKETVVDGELVALDANGKPSFNMLQNYGSSKESLLYYLFDVLMLNGKKLIDEPLSERREVLEKEILPMLAEPIRQSPVLNASLDSLIDSVKQQGVEGLVAKHSNSKYEAGQRSGFWQKMRVNQGQEFVIGGILLHRGISMRWSLAITKATSSSMRHALATASRPRLEPICSARSNRSKRINARLPICRRSRAAVGGLGLRQPKWPNADGLSPSL